MRTKAIVLGLFFLVLGEGNSQCVMCRTAAEAESKTVGLNTGILYLMAVPYVFFALALGYWYLGYRKKSSRKNKQEPPSSHP